MILPGGKFSLEIIFTEEIGGGSNRDNGKKNLKNEIAEVGIIIGLGRTWERQANL
jgi:hypothetical protein